jgi:hypothetical protein
MGTLLFGSATAIAQGGKKSHNYVPIANPPQQVVNAIESLKPELVIEAGYEDEMIIEYHYSRGSYYVQLSWVARFIEDEWGGFVFPGGATIECTGGGKIKYSSIYYEYEL